MVSQSMPCLRHCRIDLGRGLSTRPILSDHQNGCKRDSAENGELNIKGGESIHVSKVLHLIAKYCTNMEACVLNDQLGESLEEIDIEPLTITNAEPSRLSELQIIRLNEISLLDLFNAIENYCPTLRKCEIFCDRLEIPDSMDAVKPLHLQILEVEVMSL